MPTRVKPSYAPQWAVFLAVLAAGAALYRLPLMPQPAPVEVRPSRPEGADHLFILRFPEVPTEEVGAEGTKERVQQWLRALLSAGYQPVRLSAALQRLKRGQGLPKRAFAVLFTPGYRRTYDALYPLLERFHCPVSWVTDEKALAAGNQEYLSRHAVYQMKHSHFWEPGRLETSTMTFTLRPTLADRVTGFSYTFRWSPNASRRALNARADLANLHRLNLGLGWTGGELLRRLDAETPVRAPIRLTAKPLLGTLLGTYAVGTDPAAARPFDLEASPDARSVPVTWEATAGWQDLRLELSAGSLAGELWVYLHYDPDAGEGLQVGFTPTALAAIWSDGGKVRTLASIPWDRPSGGPVKAALTLSGPRLTLEADGLHHEVDGVPPLSSHDIGLTMLVVRSKLRGVARAKAVSVSMTPL